jgi:hypothetical protein
VLLDDKVRSKWEMLSVIIINWNGMGFLPDCLASIERDGRPGEYEVIVVDNVSTDGSREWLGSSEAARIFSSEGTLKTVLSDENLGFGRANNLAIKQAAGRHIFILNPDTVIKPGAIGRLREVLDSDETIGAVSPKLLNADGSLQPSVAPFPPNPVSIILQALQVSRHLPRGLRQRFYGESWEHDEMRPVPVFWGTAILARKEMIDEIGAFDDDFFMYGEDVEWCARMNRNGWKTVFVPDAEVIHLGGKSSEQAWEASETTLRKDAADVLVQKKSLSRWAVAANSLTRAALYSAAYLKRRARGKDATFLRKHIGLHWNTAKGTFARRTD